MVSLFANASSVVVRFRSTLYSMIESDFGPKRTGVLQGNVAFAGRCISLYELLTPGAVNPDAIVEAPERVPRSGM